MYLIDSLRHTYKNTLLITQITTPFRCLPYKSVHRTKTDNVPLLEKKKPFSDTMHPLSIHVFRHMMLCRWSSASLRWRRSRWFHLQGSSSQRRIVGGMINVQKAPWFFETSGTIHQTTLHHVTEDVILVKGFCENPKYRKMYSPHTYFRVTDTFTDILSSLAL